MLRLKVQVQPGERVMSKTGLPFALRKHVPVPQKELLGKRDQEWSWTPSGNLDKRDLEIYAGIPTARQSGCETW